MLVTIALRGPQVMRTNARGWQFLRGLAAIGSATCFVFAVVYVPLADAVAMSFVAAFMVTVMAALLLGENLIIRTLEVANAFAVAPVHYSLILFSTFWGYMILADLPAQWTPVGVLIIPVPGLHTLSREARHKIPPVPPVPPAG